MNNLDNRSNLNPHLLIRQIPEEPFPSVASVVMHRLEAHDRRLARVRWGVVVATATVAGILVNLLGRGIFTFAYKLVTGGVSSAGAYLAVTKLATVAHLVGDTLARMISASPLGADLSPYRPEVWALAVVAAGVIVLLMYLMGLWLRQPKGAKSWHSRSLWHSGMQAW